MLRAAGDHHCLFHMKRVHAAARERYVRPGLEYRYSFPIHRGHIHTVCEYVNSVK